MSKNVVVTITDEYIKLQQFLKMMDLISSGGQAKTYLLENNVLVDSIKETRRGRKIYPNQIVTINNVDYQITLK